MRADNASGLCGHGRQIDDRGPNPVDASRRSTAWVTRNIDFRLVVRHFIPVPLRDLGQGLWPTDARVVYQNADAPQPVFHGVHQPGDLAGLCNIRPDGQSTSANVFDLRADPLRFNFAAAEIYRNIGPGLRQSQGNSPSDAPAGSGHKGDSSSQFLAHVIPFLSGCHAAWPAVRRDGNSRHRLHQCPTKLSQLTPRSAGGLTWGHENEPLSTLDRENPGRDARFDAHRDGRSHVLVAPNALTAQERILPSALVAHPNTEGTASFAGGPINTNAAMA